MNPVFYHERYREEDAEESDATSVLTIKKQRETILEEEAEDCLEERAPKEDKRNESSDKHSKDEEQEMNDSDQRGRGIQKT